MIAVDWGSVATWAVGIFIVVAVMFLAVVCIVALLFGRGGSSQDTDPASRGDDGA